MPDEHIDKDLQKSLQQARKKPRNFAIIAKGPSCLQLLVGKKPLTAGELQEAKKACKGTEIIKGVCVGGDGPELVFRVAEKPSVTEVKLKVWIREQTGLNLKARFEVVAEVAEVNDDEPDEGTPTAPPQARTAPSEPTADITARLKILKPNLERVLAAKTSVTAEVKQHATAFATAVQQRDYETAGRLLTELESLVPRGLSELGTPPTTGGDALTAFTARLKALKPDLDKALAAHHLLSDDVKLQASAAGAAARQGNFALANQLLDELAALLPQILAGATPQEDDFPKRWAAASRAWRDASDTIDGQLNQLAAALKDSGDTELKDIAEFGLNAVTGNFKVPLMAVMRDLDGATGEARGKAITQARTIVAGFADHLSDEERVLACDENPFGVPVTIRKTLGGALADMLSVLQTAEV